MFFSLTVTIMRGRPGMIFHALALLLLLVGVFGARTARAELLAGAARVDITPDVKASKIPLGGYAARKGAASTGVHDIGCNRRQKHTRFERVSATIKLAKPGCSISRALPPSNWKGSPTWQTAPQC